MLSIDQQNILFSPSVTTNQPIPSQTYIMDKSATTFTIINELIPDDQVRRKLFDVLKNIKPMKTRNNGTSVHLTGFGKEYLVELIHMTYGGVKQDDVLTIGNTVFKSNATTSVGGHDDNEQEVPEDLVVCVDQHLSRYQVEHPHKRRRVSMSLNQEMADEFRTLVKYN